MKNYSIRLPDPIVEWINEQAIKENISFNAMIRTLLDRLKFEEEILKQLEDKKKKGK